MTYTVALPLRLSPSLAEAEEDFPGSRPSIWSGVALEARWKVEGWLAENQRAQHLVRIESPAPIEHHKRIIVHLDDRDTALLLKLGLA